jgi:Sulfotransferase family
MLLSYRYKFLFVHIAKTGGTSVRVALERERWKDPYRIPLLICSRLSAMTHHRLGVKFPRHAKVIAAKELLPRELFDELFKFAFVRNPWDLQVSSYHHIRRERPHLLQDVPDFPAFIRWKLDPERPYHYIIDTSMELQSDYLTDLSGRIIVDFIGRYERLQEDFDAVCRRTGVPPRVLPHRRQAKDRSDYRRYYDAATAELVAEHFRPDIEAFGYAFDAG